MCNKTEQMRWMMTDELEAKRHKRTTRTDRANSVCVSESALVVGETLSSEETIVSRLLLSVCLASRPPTILSVETLVQYFIFIYTL